MKCLMVLSILCSASCLLLNGGRTSSHGFIRAQKLPPLNMFNWLNSKSKSSGSDSVKSSTTGAAVTAKVDKAKVDKLRGNLAKVSNTQNRDYEAEAKARAPKPRASSDKQGESYNFNKQNEFPNLYKGWIKRDGDQIAKQMIVATKSALSKKEKFIEVLFDPVPNLDEVAFGTAWNKRLREEVAANLKVPDYATNRGGPATLEWSNLYWANRLAAGIGASDRKKLLIISLSGEGLGKFDPTFTKGVDLVTLQAAKKGTFTKVNGEQGEITEYSTLVIISPCQESHYRDAKTLADKYNIPIIALNSPYSFRYDIGGGKPFELAYVMKRIPKGWIYRQYPKPFEAIIEGPNYEVFRAKTFKEQPALPVIGKVSMEASAQRYGSGGNDRIFQQRL